MLFQSKRWRRALLAHWDILILLGLVGLAFGLRLDRLATVPGNVTADELDNLQTAYRILEGTGPSFYGLDWIPSPAFSAYVMAGSLKLFGLNIVAMRLPSVTLSTLALIPFYFLARQLVSRSAALSSTFLLSTSLLYLHFSRNGWQNMHGAFYATGAALFLVLALRRRQWLLYAAAGFFSGLVLLGYYSSTLAFAAIVAYLPMALLLGKGDRKRVALGYGLVLLVALGMFAPQLKTILENWDYATRRLQVVSVFSIKGDYLGDSSLPAILGNQFLRIVRGFFLMDSGVMGYGLWGRYIPSGHAFLDFGTSLFYWTGLAASLYHWKRTILWWSMLLALLVPQITSTGTPDVARAMPAAPFMYLFVALGIHTVLALLMWLWRRLPLASIARALATTALVAFSVSTAWSNVDGYYTWAQSAPALQLREPAVESVLFPYWQDLAIQAARQRRLLNHEEWLKWLAKRGGGIGQ